MYRDDNFPLVSSVPVINSGLRRRHYNFPHKSRIYAISDTHGCLPVLEESLELIARDLVDNPPSSSIKTSLATLGDMIDKGRDSRPVIDRSIRCEHTLVALGGNHEKGLGDFINGPCIPNATKLWADQSRQWLIFAGGAATLESYGLPTSDLKQMLDLSKKEITDDARFEMINGFRKSLYHQIVMAGHLDYFENLRSTAQWRHFIFCHAQILPHKPLEEHALEEVITGRDIVNYYGKYLNGAVVVHGHTGTGCEPILRPNSIGIDPAAMRVGKPLVLAFEYAAQVDILTREGKQTMNYPRAEDAPVHDVQTYKTGRAGSIRVSLDPRRTAELEKKITRIGPERPPAKSGKDKKAKQPLTPKDILRQRAKLFQKLAGAHHVPVDLQP